MPRNIALIVGIGLTRFTKPQSTKCEYSDIGHEAATNALADAKLQYTDVEAVIVSHVYGESTSGQKAIYKLGLTGVPIFNTNNNCSSASCALMLAQLLVKSGQYQCVLALGFEQMSRGLETKWDDRTHPAQEHFDRMENLGVPAACLPGMNKFTSDVVKIFAYAAEEHMRMYGTTSEQFAKIAYKNHVHSINNPNASMQFEIPMEKCLAQPFCGPITSAMCAMTADGGAAAVVCSRTFARRKRLTSRAVEIIGQQMKTDLHSSFHSNLKNIGGHEMARLAAEDCYKQTGLCARDVDVLEVHDCFAPNELFMYEALGLCEEGCGGKMIDEAEWIYNKNGGKLCQLGGRWVVNPDGGLEGKGHPIGATGLAQCAELVTQLRGEAGLRQVDGARIGLQHNFGIGGAAVVTIYEKYTDGDMPLLESKL